MLENLVTENTPVVDLTGLTNQYEWEFNYKIEGASEEESKRQILQAFHDQLGLILLPPICLLRCSVIEKAN